MLFIIISLIAGIVFGYIFRKKLKFIKILDKSSGYIIFFLLFFLGLSVGINEKIIKNIGYLGIKAVLISAGAIAGSIICGLFVYIFFFKDKKDDRQS
jgi:uncharacterized membrane protein YbjE (DUF340 family)